VYRVCGLHPEFGYFGNPAFFRIMMVYMACGLVAGAVSFAVFKSVRDPNPMDAMALAPADALIGSEFTEPVTQSEKALANRPSPQQADKEEANASSKGGSIKPTCGESVGNVRQSDCAPVRVVRIRPPRAANERPPIAAAPIGHVDDPTTVLPASPPPVIALSPSQAVSPELKATPASTKIAEPKSAIATPVAAKPAPAASAPTIVSKRSQSRVDQASRRRTGDDYYAYASNSRARSSGGAPNRHLWTTFAYAHSW
jgi:hypothetical protein